MENSLCLAIDTAYEHGAVVLFRDHEIIFSAALMEKYSHGETLCDAITSVMNICHDQNLTLDAVLCGLGPGSFVGVRIALATALGFSLGKSLPIMGFCSHKALAYSANSYETMYIYMKASGDLGYLSRFDANGHGNTRVVSIHDLVNELPPHVQLLTDQPERLRDIVKSEMLITGVQGPTLAGAHAAALERVRKSGISDESSFIKPNYIKPPSVSVPKHVIAPLPPSDLHIDAQQPANAPIDNCRR